MVAFLGRKLGGGKGKEGDAGGGGNAVFCYVNSVFAPGLDEGVGGLWRVSFQILAFVWGEKGREGRGLFCGEYELMMGFGW